MSNRVLIFAGGTGVRMNTNGLPKQFLELLGKPTLIHTVDKFEQCDQIDDIVIVCLADWIDYTNSLLLRYNIKKVSAVISGGETGFDSRYIGLEYLCNHSSDPDSDIVLIHDGVRPIIDNDLIVKCIEEAKAEGNAITISPATETIMYVEEDTVHSLERSKCIFAKAPQVFLLNDIYQKYQMAKKDGKTELIDSATIAMHYGQKLHFVMGPVENIKMTNPSDYYLLRGLMEAEEYLKYFKGSKVQEI